jgi:dCMP deaminase
VIERPGWDEYFLNIATVVARRADCTRRQVGAVLVTPDHRIIATGYNGSPPGALASCLAGGCPRGQQSYEDTPPGSPYGACIAVHAEHNAILYAPQDKVRTATLYCTDQPCAWCATLVTAMGVARVVVGD